MTSTETTHDPNRAGSFAVQIGLPQGWTSVRQSDTADIEFTLQAFATAAAAVADANLIADGLGPIGFSAAPVESLHATMAEKIVLAAGWASPVHDNGFLELLAASLTVAVEPIDGLNTASSPDIRQALTEAANQVLDRFDPTSSQYRFVDRPTGEAVRIAWSDSRSEPWLGSAIACRVVQFIHLVADREAIVVLTFETPSVNHLDKLEQLFDVIASTLQLFTS